MLPTRSACSRRSRRCCRTRPIRFRSLSARRPAPYRRPCSARRRIAGSARSRRSSTSGRTFMCHRYFGSMPASMLRSGLHWVLSLISGGMLLPPPLALFDNSPLRALLADHLDWHGLQPNIDGGHLRALALCATSYSSATSVAFFQGTGDAGEWVRQQRVGRRTGLRLEHVMASLGVPFLFPPVQLGDEFFGDGAQRQLWPLSPAIHLGADRLLVIGVRAEHGAGVNARPRTVVQGPTPRTVVRLHARYAVYGSDLRQRRAHAAPQQRGRSRASRGAGHAQGGNAGHRSERGHVRDGDPAHRAACRASCARCCA